MVEYYGYVMFLFQVETTVLYFGPFDWTGSVFVRNHVQPLMFQGSTL